MTILSVDSLSDDWSSNSTWASIPKHFYVTVTNDDGSPVSEAKVTASADNGVKAVIVNDTAITDSYGSVDLAVTLDFSGLTQGVKIVTVTFTAGGTRSTGSGNGGDGTATFALYPDPDTIAKPNIPLAVDGVIDDKDVTSGVFVSVIDKNLAQGNTVVLCWDFDTVTETVISDKPQGAFLFNMVPYNESLLTNGTHTVTAYTVDNSRNASFSQPVTFRVDRKEGGGGLPYLNAASIAEGEDGVINEKDMYAGLTIIIPDSTRVSSDSDNFEHSLNSTCTGSIILRGYSQSGKFISSLSIPFDLSTPDTNITYTPDDGTTEGGTLTYKYPQGDQSLVSFLLSIGEGYLTVGYNVVITSGAGVGKSYSADTDTKYYVDVTPPGY